MPIALNRDIRKLLETAVRHARVAAEAGAQAALGQLGVADAKKPTWLTDKDAALRVRLRAHARALGDALDTGDPVRMPRLIREIAYAHWHRALFARFLQENGLLVDVEAGNAPVRPSDLRDIAEAEGKDEAEVAAEFAAPMLPEIFPKDDPVLALALPPETRQRLAELVVGLPAQTFKADDSLGWTYQFWQADRKKKVNESEAKIGADELPAVTQLFTEDYMVLFLLENTLGAWWAGKKLAENPQLARDVADEDALRRAVSTPGYAWTYLRFVREDETWRPAAGTFPGWPARAAEITVLDPCMGSGHFLVFALDILVALRKAEEGLTEDDAVVAVLRDNLHGLEIDPRCTQIAAFALALVAWKRLGGVRQLPALHLACSGLTIGVGKPEFIRLAEKIAEAESFAGEREDLLGRQRNPAEERALALQRGGLERLYDLFAQAPALGSLIDPRRALGDFGTLFSGGFEELSKLLEKALQRTIGDADSREVAVVAQGLAKAAELLSHPKTLICTNVPYLGRGDMDNSIRDYIDKFYSHARQNLATAIVQRFTESQSTGETCAIVLPSSFLTLKTYTKLRHDWLSRLHLVGIARIGAHSFETISGQVVNVSFLISNKLTPSHSFWLDVSNESSINIKQKLLVNSSIDCLFQLDYTKNKGEIISRSTSSYDLILGNYVESFEGTSRGDAEKFDRFFWELGAIADDLWSPLLNSPSHSGDYTGREVFIRWERGAGDLASSSEARICGRQLWGEIGIAIARTSGLKATILTGEMYAQNIIGVSAKNRANLEAIFCFTSSPEFSESVRKINQKPLIPSALIKAIPFDIHRWQRVSAAKFPNGLRKPYSNDPTQWLFDGHPRGAADPKTLDGGGRTLRPGMAEHPLQVAVARLLAYHWPRQTGSSFMDCPAIAEPDEVDRAGVIDEDGIVCLPAIHGEAPAHERLRAVLMAAWGEAWGEGVVRACLEDEGWTKDLESWLTDGFFEGHCRLFHQTPFIWHVWDGAKGGFSALVNYHKLCAPNGEGRRTLEKLRDTYLGQWIGDLRRAVANDPIAEDRLAAAEHLRDELTKIIEGEPPYDIFVRWKPLHEQPIGWEPDIDDGVRLNIRPFLTARPRGKPGKKACILRVTPGVKKHEGADRGGEPHRDKADYPWFWAEDHDVATVDFAGGPEFTGRRYNDFHYTRAFKQAARDRKAGKSPGSEAVE